MRGRNWRVSGGECAQSASAQILVAKADVRPRRWRARCLMAMLGLIVSQAGQATLVREITGSGDGISAPAIAIDGDQVVMAQPQTGDGNAVLFQVSSGAVAGNLPNPVATANAGYGGFGSRNVDVDNGRVVVGASLDDQLASDSGAVFVFDQATGGDCTEFCVTA